MRQNHDPPHKAVFSGNHTSTLNAGTTNTVGGLDLSYTTFGAAGGRTTPVLLGHATLAGAASRAR